MRTVRDAAYDVMRRHGMTTIFGNPGSTEIPFLTDLPADLRFVLGLHEGSVVGMATGYALGRGEPSFVNLHTAPGLGNAVNAIAGARDNRVPLVVVVGQQDRRQLALAPFLTGRALERLAGDYPVWANQPARAQDVPGAIARAWHEARTHRGPALVVVPMGDWSEPADPGEDVVDAAPARLVHAIFVDPSVVDELADMVAASASPALVVGAGNDGTAEWESAVELAERLACPVWQDPFCSRAGFPQDNPLFAGHLPWSRRGIRDALAANDLVVAVGASAFRLYLYEPGLLVASTTRIAVITDDPEEAHRSPAELAVLAPPAAVCRELAARVPQRAIATQRPPSLVRPEAPSPPPAGQPLLAKHVLSALADRLPRDVVLVEEAPSSRPELLSRIATRSPLGFVSVANGALGFGLPGAIGLRLALPDRPVVAVIGDGSSIYAVQSLWSAAQYGVGVLFVVMANGRYAVMDGLARDHGGVGAWPAFDSVSLATLAAGFGCPARRIADHDELLRELGEIIPRLAERREPLLLEVAIAPDV